MKLLGHFGHAHKSCWLIRWGGGGGKKEDEKEEEEEEEVEEEVYLKEASLVLQKCKSLHASTSPLQVDARGGGSLTRVQCKGGEVGTKLHAAKDEWFEFLMVKDELSIRSFLQQTIWSFLQWSH